MARASRNAASEYSGTESGNSGTESAIDPRAVDGSVGNSGNDSGSGSEQFDPAIHVSPDKRNADGSFTRKRGRKAGSAGKRNNPKAAAADLGTSIEALSKTIVILHTGISALSGIPEIAIDKTEGDILANATANVLAQFDIAPDPKTQAIIGMIMACGAVYAPRVIAYRMRTAQEQAEKQEGAAGVYAPDGTPQGTTGFQVVN